MPLVELEVGGRMRRVEVEAGFTPADLDYIASQLEQQAAPEGGGDEEEDIGLGRRALAFGARVAAPIVGGVGGGVVTGGNPLGAAVGAGVTATAAEPLIQKYIEGREEVSLPEVAVAGGTALLAGGAPRGAAALARTVGATEKVARVARVVGGGVEGVAATGAHTLATEGRLPTATEAVTAGTLGAGLERVGMAIEGRLARRATPSEVAPSGAAPEVPADVSGTKPGTVAQPSQGADQLTLPMGGADFPAGGSAAPAGRVAASVVDDLFPELEEGPRAVLRDVLQRNQAAMEAQTRGVVSRAQQKATAEAMQLDTRLLPTGTALNAEQKELLTRTASVLAQQVDDISKQLVDAPNDQALLAQLADVSEQLTNVEVNLFGARSEAGRTLGSFAELITDPAAKRRHAELASVRAIRDRAKEQGLPWTKDDTQALAYKLNGVKVEHPNDIEKQTLAQFKIIQDTIKFRGIKDRTPFAQQWMLNSMLSGLDTQERNILGNTIPDVLLPVKIPVAAAISKARTLAGGEQTTFAGELPKAIKAGFRFAWQRGASGELPGYRKAVQFFLRGYDDAALKHPEKSLLSLAKGQTLVDTELAVAGELGFPWWRAPGRLLGAMDIFFRGTATEMAAHRAAYAAARREGLKSTADIQKRMGELLAERPVWLMKEAERFGERAVFQEQPGLIGSTVLEAKAGAQRKLREQASKGKFPAFVSGVGGVVLQRLAPFVKTPSNLIRRGLLTSPAGVLLAPGEIRRAGKGLATASKSRVAEDIAADVVIGLVAAYPIYRLAERGIITGAAPQDEAEKARFYAAGGKPDSIKIGDAYVSTQVLGHLATPVNAIANAVQAHQRGELTEDALFKQLVNTMAGAQESIAGMSFFKSIRDLTDLMTDPDGMGGDAEKRVAKYLGETATTFIPRIAQQAAQALDEPAGVRGILRDTPQSASEAVGKALPVGPLKELAPPPKIEVDGEFVTQRPFLKDFTRQAAKGNEDVLKELDRLNRDVRRRDQKREGAIQAKPDSEPGAAPQKRGATLEGEGWKIRLSSADDLAYRRALAAAVFREQADVFDSPAYQQAQDDRDRLEMMEDAEKEAAKAVRDLVKDLVLEGVSDAEADRIDAGEVVNAPSLGLRAGTILEEVGYQ